MNNAFFWFYGKIKEIRIDFWIFIPVLILGLLGTLTIYSATGTSVYVDAHFKRFLFGLGIMLFITQINPDILQSFFSRYFYFINVVLLLLVLVMGVHAMGATRWLNLGFINFQPSELVKITLPMFLAYIIFKNENKNRIRDILKYGFIIAIPAMLTMIQPDLGTSLIIIASGMAVLFMSGLNYAFIFSVGALVSLLFPIFWNALLGYQKQRVLTMLNPEIDPMGSGYHIIQSKIAIGNGGFIGNGFLSGTQTQLGFIPEQHTDFIFSAFAEEFGFMGLILVLCVYLVLLSRLFFIISRLNSVFQKLTVGSFAFVFALYIFINLGMISGILPVVGVPLPFFSYGGTSMIIQMVIFGIIGSFYTHNYIGEKNKYK